VLAWSCLLLIRGILAALRQKFHLTTCPNSPGHLYLHHPHVLGAVAVAMHDADAAALNRLNGRQHAGRQVVELRDEGHAGQERDSHQARPVVETLMLAPPWIASLTNPLSRKLTLPQQASDRPH
jgi:hypothetical protein